MKPDSHKKPKSPDLTGMIKSPAFICVTAYTLILYAGWTIAWLIILYVKANSRLLNDPLSEFIYWTAMRMILWVYPAILLLRRFGFRFSDVFPAGRIKSIILWGAGAGLASGLTTIIYRLLSKQTLIFITWDWPLITKVVLAPIVEELFFRGAVCRVLMTRIKFPAANLLTGLLFLMAHIPGWYFKGNLADMLLSPAGGALGVLVLGWVFGFAAYKGRSVAAGILAHAVNNFFAM